MSNLFSNHSNLTRILKHKRLPIYLTSEFDFYRCVEFKDAFYGKTVSELHNGNLRINDQSGRYSKLFADEKISYWADSPKTGLKEIRRHGAGSKVITFWAYDDSSSAFPTVSGAEPLLIVDGRDLQFGEILKKVEKGILLNENEESIVKDCSGQGKL